MKPLKGERLNILMFAPVPPPFGGIGNWLNTVRAAISDDPDITMEIIDIAPKTRTTEGRSLLQRIADGIRTTSHSLGRLNKACRGVESADCVHLTTSGSLAVFRDYCLLRKAKKKKIPSSYHLHFGRIPDLVKSESWEMRMIMRNVDLSTVTVCLDDSTFDSLVSCGVSHAKLKKIPNPLHVSELREQSGAEGNGTKEKNIIYIGWVIQTKGVEELLLAWEQVCEQFPDWQLIIVGPCRANYQEKLLSSCPERVAFVGELEHGEAMRELASASVLVLPSYTEAFPTVVMEAMACSVPVIATAVGAIPEMLGDARGVVVPPKDVNGLAQAIETTISDAAKMQSLGECGYRFVRDNYDLPAVIDQYKNLWKECAASGRV